MVLDYDIVPLNSQPNQRGNMRRITTLIAMVTVLLVVSSCGGGGSLESDQGNITAGAIDTGVQGGQKVVSDAVIAKAEEKRDETQEVDSETQENDSKPVTLSADNVEPEELNEAPSDSVEEDDIEVSEAEEDPLDGVLNAVSKFQSCLADEGVEFIGAPGQPGPDGNVVDPSEFTAEYLGALQMCATESDILNSFTAFSEAQANLTPEEITQLNFGIPVFKECMERLGWEVADLVPDERGQLGFGTTGTGLTPPEGTEGLLNTDDINECRQESQQYAEENYEVEED